MPQANPMVWGPSGCTWCPPGDVCSYCLRSLYQAVVFYRLWFILPCYWRSGRGLHNSCKYYWSNTGLEKFSFLKPAGVML